jgi:PmbA protein
MASPPRPAAVTPDSAVAAPSALAYAADPLTAARTAVAAALARAQAQGASQAEASVHASSGHTVQVRRGELERIEHHTSLRLSITVYRGGRKGSASTSDTRPEEIAAAVDQALEIARHTGEDPYAGLLSPEDLAASPPGLDLDHPAALTLEEDVEEARAAEAAAFAADPRIVNSEGAQLRRNRGVLAYGNSHGFLDTYVGTRHTLSCTVVAATPGAGTGTGMQRDYWDRAGRRPEDLGVPAECGREAARRALRRLGGRSLPSRRAPVLFEAPVAGGLIGHLLAAIDGGALYRRASFLLDALGQPVLPVGCWIREAPHLPAGLGSAPFDGDGAATRAKDLVADGVLTSYLLDGYAARRLGLATTGNAGGYHNVLVEPGPLALPALIRLLHCGLLVTEVLGFGVNPITGDYSRGVSGLWVEGGGIQYPVEEITLAGNLKDMYRRIVAIGADVDRRGTLHTGSILIEEMTLAGH